MRRTALLLVATAWGMPSRADEAAAGKVPPSFVEQYRVDSQYGPPDAVLNERYPRQGKVELGLGLAYSSFSSLMKYSAAQGFLAIHFNRRHAIEPLSFGYYFASPSAFTNAQVRDKISASAQSQSQVELPKMSFAASYLFSPYYAKMHITEQTVTHFDTYVGAGFAVLKTNEHFLNGTQGLSFTRPAAVLTLGLRFLFPKRFGLRVDLRDFVDRSRNFNREETTHTLQAMASLSVFLGTFAD